MGTVLIIGGGQTPEAAIKEFIQAAGGAEARIVILAHVQQELEAGAARSADFFREMGAHNVEAPGKLPAPELASLLKQAKGVYIPGGNQNRFVELFPASSGVWEAIREVYRRGGVVGGTSAGASLMGGLMPTGAETGIEGLQVGACPLAPSPGVLPKVIVDQHFLKRNRLQRLLAAVLEHPQYVGIGLDEGAWAVVRKGRLTVRAGQVVHIRVSGKTHHQGTLLGANRVQLQILLPGETCKIL